MIQLPDDAEYSRLSRATARPARKPRAVAAGASGRAAGTAGESVRARSPEPVPALPVDTDPPPGWLPTPESRAAMDALLPPMGAEPDPAASATALDVAEAGGDIPLRARAMLARRLHRYGAILDDPDSSAADVVAVGRALAALGGLGDVQPSAQSRQPIQIAFVVQGSEPRIIDVNR